MYKSRINKQAANRKYRIKLPKSAFSINNIGWLEIWLSYPSDTVSSSCVALRLFHRTLNSAQHSIWQPVETLILIWEGNWTLKGIASYFNLHFISLLICDLPFISLCSRKLPLQTCFLLLFFLSWFGWTISLWMQRKGFPFTR